MADNAGTSQRNLLLGILLGAALVALGVLGYLYYQQQREVVKIDVPGFSGTITKEEDGATFSGEFGGKKEKDVRVDVD